MKIIIVLGAVFVAFCTASNIDDIFVYNDIKSDFFNSTGNLREGIFDTPLDHFTPTDDRLLRQRYVANVESFQTNGPLFFFVSYGLGDERYLRSGLVADLARELNGSVVRFIPRYFDDYTPLNLTVENLRYLTFDHQLADIPILINKVKKDLESPASRVIVFGSFERGRIAALARKKFPHIVHGVWSSSGIFRADTVDTEYYNTLAWSLHQYGSQNCSSAIGQALAQAEQLITSRNSERLRSLFGLCEPINFDNVLDVQFLYERIFNLIPRALNDNHLAGLQQLCNNVTSATDQLTSYARYHNEFFQPNRCSNFTFANLVTILSNTSSRVRSSYYARCLQFGVINLPVTTEDGFGNVFPNVLNQSYYESLCHAAFGDVFNFTLWERAVENFNLQHGSQNQVITNAIFTNGGLDPLIGHGISEYDIYTSEAITTELTGASADFGSISENDSAELRETKERIIQTLTQFATPEVDADDEEEIDPK